MWLPLVLLINWLSKTTDLSLSTNLSLYWPLSTDLSSTNLSSTDLYLGWALNQLISLDWLLSLPTSFSWLVSFDWPAYFSRQTSPLPSSFTVASLNSLQMALANYQDILLAHEQEFWDSQGRDRQELVQEIMQEIVAQSKGTLEKKTLKGLDTVSPQIQTSYLEIFLTWT